MDRNHSWKCVAGLKKDITHKANMKQEETECPSKFVNYSTKPGMKSPGFWRTVNMHDSSWLLLMCKRPRISWWLWQVTFAFAAQQRVQASDECVILQMCVTDKNGGEFDPQQNLKAFDNCMILQRYTKNVRLRWNANGHSKWLTAAPGVGLCCCNHLLILYNGFYWSLFALWISREYFDYGCTYSIVQFS